MRQAKRHIAGDVEKYVRSVSIASRLNLSEERLTPHFREFTRLLNDADVLNEVVTGADFIHIGPIVTYTHTKVSLEGKQD